MDYTIWSPRELIERIHTLEAARHTTYNGWSNYATWRVNLEMIDGRDWSEEGENAFESVSMLADNVQEWCESILEEYVQSDKGDNGISIVLSYALAFLADVNWYEIAKHIAEDYPKLVAETV